jgi:hypothetical protein
MVPRASGVMGWALAIALAASACGLPPAAVPRADVELLALDAMAALSLICSSCSVAPLPTRKVEPAAILSIGGGRLAYNRPMLRRMAVQYGEDAVFAIFAHEIGHVIDLQRGDEPLEASADMHAGCALAIAGREPDGFIELLEDENTPNDTYPDTEIRIQAVVAGYLECSMLWFDGKEL